MSFCLTNVVNSEYVCLNRIKEDKEGTKVKITGALLLKG